MLIYADQLTTDYKNVPETLSRMGEALWRFGQYLNSVEFYQLSLAIGVHVTAVIFSIFAVIMIALLIADDSPRPKRHFLWTWIVLSLAFFLIRAVAIVRFGDDGRIFIFALAWWNLMLSGAVSLTVYAGQAAATLAGKNKVYRD